MAPKPTVVTFNPVLPSTRQLTASVPAGAGTRGNTDAAGSAVADAKKLLRDRSNAMFNLLV
jgi:hypothetical protein